MIVIDIFSCYVIAGSSAILGAGAIQLIRSDDIKTNAALRTCTLGFLLLGLGLFQLFIQNPKNPQPLSLYIAINGVLLGLAVYSWGWRQLNGFAVNPIYRGLGLTCIVSIFTWSYYQGVYEMAVATSLLGLAISISILIDQYKFILNPTHVADKALGVFFIAFCFIWAVHAFFTLQYEGPAEPHLMLLPVWFRSVFLFICSLLPLLLALLLMSMVNARLYTQVHSKSLTDDLTGLLSRRALRELAPAVVQRAQSEKKPLAVFMLDLDHFKSINDRYGHLAGDDVLRQVAQLLQEKLRPGELLVRLGGEEFFLLFQTKDAHSARTIGDRLRKSVAEKPCHSEGMLISMSISIGGCMQREGEALEAAMLRADEALYRAKRGGRNRVEIDELSFQTTRHEHSVWTVG
jgi:diguanylate cyclase (GGDEF)-like protein